MIEGKANFGLRDEGSGKLMVFSRNGSYTEP